MVQRDYVLRLIEMFVKVLARILKLKEEKKYDLALAEIGEAYRSLLGIPAQFVHSMSDSDLLAFLKRGDQFNADKLIVLAELVKEEGDIWVLENRSDEAGGLYIKSLSLYLASIAEESRFQTEATFVKIDTVIDALKSYDLPTSVKTRLMAYYEFRGRFADAENMLFELADPDDRDVLHAGVSFYDRMSLKSTSELVAGNLPPEEVVEGLRAFQKKMGIDES
jgi:hypothetical protein